MRVENGKAYMRRLAGGAGGGVWQETTDFSSSFAPNGDALAFLSGIKNVREAPAEELGGNPSRSTQHAARFTFDLDGPALASYLRDRLEEQLADREGKLRGRDHRHAAAVPQRDRAGRAAAQRCRAAAAPVRAPCLPGAAGQHVEADIKTDFAGFPAPNAVAETRGRGDTARGYSGGTGGWSPRLPVSVSRYLPQAGRLLFVLALCTGTLAFLLAGRRRRQVYAAVVIAVILSMVVAPVLQNERVVAFSQEQVARRVQQDRQEQDQEARAGAGRWPARVRPAPRSAGAAGFRKRSGPAPPGPQAATGNQASPGPRPGTTTSAELVGDPPEEPDCTGQDTNDRDGDGLNNLEECKRGLGTTAETDKPGTDKPDHDGDGLLDGLEVYQLGTEPTLADTDGDWITDTLEVHGYPLGNNTWYLNPLKADTDGDGAG
jgi:type II secretory pathway pseudopilin PulG